jgi:hypothetical protein
MGKGSPAGLSANGASGAVTCGGVGGTGGVGGVGGVGAAGGSGIGGENSCWGFVSLFGDNPQAVSTFQVHIHSWTVVSIVAGVAVSVVLPHVQFHTHTHVVGRPPAGAGPDVVGVAEAVSSDTWYCGASGVAPPAVCVTAPSSPGLAMRIETLTFAGGASGVGCGAGGTGEPNAAGALGAGGGFAACSVVVVVGTGACGAAGGVGATGAVGAVGATTVAGAAGATTSSASAACGAASAAAATPTEAIRMNERAVRPLPCSVPLSEKYPFTIPLRHLERNFLTTCSSGSNISAYICG